MTALLSGASPDHAGVTADRLTLSAAALSASAGEFGYPQQFALVQKLLRQLLTGNDVHGLRIRSLPPDVEAVLPQPLGETLERQLRGLMRNSQGQTLACQVLLRYDALLPIEVPESGPSSFMLETVTPLPSLNGQTLRFDCLLESHATWPLQVLLLNGLIQFGPRLRAVARRTPAVPEDPPAAEDEDASAPTPFEAAEPDGGPPRIGVAQWFEARVLRSVTQFFWRRGWFV